MPLHPLITLEIQKYYQNKAKFNGVYSRSTLSKIKDGAYVINLDEYEFIGPYWVSMCVKATNVT